MALLKNLKGQLLILLAATVVSAVLLTACQLGTGQQAKTATPTPKPTPTPTIPPTPTPTPTPTPIPTLPPVQDPGTILGVNGAPTTPFPNIPWIRISYPNCVAGPFKGNVLKTTIQQYHSQGIRVLLIVCQGTSGPKLFDTTPLNDAARGGADAVQCGNEQMKYNPPATIYISPDRFAKFYDLCERAMRAVNPAIPVLMGSLDPHVGGVDYQPLVNQAGYLNEMEYAMNTQVHPGGSWRWRSQAIGLIDSWHNGYPSDSVNSLYWLFAFWAQQFGVDLNSGSLGKHLWVIEGTGCFKGCGINPYNSYQVAVSHILTLITDVRTALRYKVPFFYFSGQDFVLADGKWPIGILDLKGHSKPIRQDLPMGAITLTMSCSTGKVSVADQEQLLAKLYAGCSLPANYRAILAG